MKTGIERIPEIPWGAAVEIKGNEGIKEPYLLNNEERRFFDGEKLFGETNEKIAGRCSCIERVSSKRRLTRIPSAGARYLAAFVPDPDSQNLDRKRRM
jgi:hypothetical protein